MAADRRDTRGFAGLDSLGSDVSSELSRAGEIGRTTAPLSPPSTQEVDPAHGRREASGPIQGPQPAAGTSFLSRRGKLIVGIAAVLGAIWFFSGSNGMYKTANYAPVEEPPPVGTGITLSPNQVRYCLAESIRMDGARSAVNQYLSTDVDHFNAMVADYNSRCGSFRYRSGTLESVKSEVEAGRDRLWAQGAWRFR